MPYVEGETLRDRIDREKESTDDTELILVENFFEELRQRVAN